MTELFGRAFPASTILDRFDAASVQTMPPSELAEKRLVAAHLPEWVARRRLSPTYKVGLSRHPWSRFSSIVRHYVRDARANAPPLHAKDFLAALMSGEMRRAFEMVGDWYNHYDSLTGFYAPNPSSSYASCEAAADAAIAAIESYDLIVPTELLADVYPLLARLCLQPDVPALQLNSAKEFGQDDDDMFGFEFERRFRKLAAYDYRVHDALKRRAKDTLQSLRAALDEQPTYRQALAAQVGGKREFALEVAHDTIARSGWDRPVPATGGRFAGLAGLRLNAAGALVDFGVPAMGPLHIEFGLWVGGGLEALASARLTLNGKPFVLGEQACMAIEDAHDRCAITLVIDHEVIADGFCRFSIEVPQPGLAPHFWLFFVRARVAQPAEPLAKSTIDLADAMDEVSDEIAA